MARRYNNGNHPIRIKKESQIKKKMKAIEEIYGIT